MQHRTKVYAGVSLALLLAGGAGIAGAAGSGGAAESGSGSLVGAAEVARAAEAAIARAGGGEITEIEVDHDELAFYEVEIRTADGREHEVELDRDFNLVDYEVDDD